MTQCQASQESAAEPEGRGGSQRAEPYSSCPSPIPWDPTILDGRRRYSQEWCRRMIGKCGKGAASKGAGGTRAKGVQPDDEEMAYANAQTPGEQMGTSHRNGKLLIALRHNNDRRLLRAFRTYEEACFNAYKDLEEAVIGDHVDEEEAMEP